MKKQKKKEITKETVIIVGLICFVTGYAVNTLIGSISSFTRSPVTSGTGITEPQQTNSPVQSQIEILKDRLTANPENASAWINLGNSYFDSNRHKEAIDAYLRALELAPGNPDVLSDLGVMYRRVGNPKKALSVFDEAHKVDSSHTMSLFNKGIVLFHDLDEKKEALEVWRQVTLIDPGFKMPTGELMIDFLTGIKGETDHE